MISDLFFYQLLLVGLLWLCLMLHGMWPSERVMPGSTRPPPLPPPRKRSSDPQPFPGLTRKPPCAACEQAHASAPQPPGCPPPRKVPARGRPRQVDTSFHFCPNANCASRGWVSWGNLSANGHPSGGPWRQWYCTVCKGYFLETHGTLLHGKRVGPDVLGWAVGARAEGLGIRAIPRGLVWDHKNELWW